MNELYPVYSRVKIKANGFTGAIVEYDDDGGRKPAIYLIELDEEFYTDPDDALIWLENGEFEIIHDLP